KVESIPLMVIKKDKTRQPFDREKLINGLLRACEKRPVSVDTLEKLADEIELQILNSLKREITTKEIGEMVMARLKDIDEVAYVRFASVYRQFKDINTFMEELHKLLKENEKLQENEQQEENGQDDHK
ncbi:MAG TPA: transcriptional regulator NrdR, partial [Clostridiales bacterium]|nr:transcriptional regulator NrdR [Clostridiales bacterium]